MSNKRKHKTLTLEEKGEILKKIDSGQSVRGLAKLYGVGKSTVFDLKKRKEKILTFISSNRGVPSKRKTLKLSENPEVDAAVYTWYLEETCRGTQVSGELIREKAKVFYAKITGKDDFRASSGWLEKFKKRHGIRRFNIAKSQTLEPCQDRVLSKIQELNLVPDQVYCGKQSELFWRLLPKQVLVRTDEEETLRQKINRDCIMFMPCTNFTGSHKLEMLIIGKDEFTNSLDLPGMYGAQGRISITREILIDWFQFQFVPSVRKQMEQLNLTQQALLIIDTPFGNAKEEEFVSDDHQITVIFAPSSITPLLQEMDQIVIRSIKLNYRKTLLMHIITEQISAIRTLETFSFEDSMFFLKESWQSVDLSLIQKSWDNMWPTQDPFSTISEDLEVKNMISLIVIKQEVHEQNDDVIEITKLLNQIRTGEDMTTDEVMEWIVDNNVDDLPAILTDNEIVESIKRGIADGDEVEGTSRVVKHSDAVTSFNFCLQWASENGISSDHVQILRQIREHAVKALSEEMK